MLELFSSAECIERMMFQTTAESPMLASYIRRRLVAPDGPNGSPAKEMCGQWQLIAMC